MIREAVDRYLAGESLRGVTIWLNTTHVTPVIASSWQTTAVRQIISSGRIAGLREHHGQEIGPAVWPAIITPAQRDRVLARLAARTLTKTRAPTTYLLSGMLRCGRCGDRLYSQARHTNPQHRVRRYVCLSGPDHGGCGRLTVVAEPVEALLTDAQLRDRWEDPDLGLDRQHAIIKTLLDHAVIAPGTPGSRSLDINRVVPQWRI